VQKKKSPDGSEGGFRKKWPKRGGRGSGERIWTNKRENEKSDYLVKVAIS